LAIEWLKEASQTAVGEQLGLSWDEIHGLMERAVKRGLERRKAESVPKLGVDEKAFRKGHSYFTLVNDLTKGQVLYVAEGREQASLDGFWETLTPQQKASIEAVTPMWLRFGSTCGERRRRWYLTSSTSPSIWARRWIEFDAASRRL
jgi:transposase